MREIKVEDSKNIKTIFYVQEKQELWVFFKSSTLYIYEKVPSDLVVKLEKSDSKGEFFHKYIRASFSYIQKY